MKKKLFNHVLIIIILWLTVVCTNTSIAQISPPGLGEANTASWLAFGIRQSLDSANKMQSTSYVGFGRKSTLSTNNPFQQQAILVLNQEFYHRFHKHWHYSVALSYRNQNEYEEAPPYEPSSPAHKQEFRVYGRFIYELKVRNLKLAATCRQEFRSFFDPNFDQTTSPYQLRSRFRLQAALTLDEAKVHRLTVSAEALFSTTLSTSPENQWSRFGYKEARFCFYYSMNPKNTPFTYSIGYMNDLIGTTELHSAGYIAFDVIWENPFKAPKKVALKLIE